MLLKICMALALYGYAAMLGGCDDPLLLWTQKSYIWSKIKGLQGLPNTWLPLKLKPYVQSQTYKESYKYAITYNPLSEEVIWSDIHDNNIVKQTLKGNVYHADDAIKELYVEDSAEISSLAVDWFSNNVYFINKVTRSIGVQSLDEAKTNIHKTLFKEDDYEPVSLAVDPFEGLVFWTNAAKGSVDVASGNGNLLISIVTDLKKPQGIALDMVSKKLFYIDDKTINRVNYNGTNRETLWTSQTDKNYFQMTLMQDNLLLSTGNNLQIHVHSKTSGDFVGSADIDAEVYHIVAAENLTLPPHHACHSLNCEHLCLNIGLHEPGQCACAAGFTLTADGRGCTIVPVATEDDKEDNNLVIIAGAAAAAAFFLLLLGLLFCCCALQRCKQQKKKDALRSVSQESFSIPGNGNADAQLYANAAMFSDLEQGPNVRDSGNEGPTSTDNHLKSSIPVQAVEKSFKSRMSKHVSKKNKFQGVSPPGSAGDDDQAEHELPSPEDSPPPSSTVSLSSIQSTRPLSSGSSKNFQLQDDKKVATVIQRLTNRLRKGLSSIRFNESQRRPGIDTTGQEDDPANGEEIHEQIRSYPEMAKFPPNKRKIHIPSKLHKEPRGWAPASHNVPRTVISTLGRAKGKAISEAK